MLKITITVIMNEQTPRLGRLLILHVKKEKTNYQTKKYNISYEIPI